LQGWPLSTRLPSLESLIVAVVFLVVFVVVVTLIIVVDYNIAFFLIVSLDLIHGFTLPDLPCRIYLTHVQFSFAPGSYYTCLYFVFSRWSQKHEKYSLVVCRQRPA